MSAVLKLLALASLVSALSMTVSAAAPSPAEQTITRHYTPADRVGGRYQYVPFDVPDGAVRVRVEQHYDRANGENAVDLGLFEPGSVDFGSRALRGWSGGARTTIELTPAAATPGYRPGPLPGGRWHVVLGLYKVSPAGVSVTLRITVDSGPTPGGDRQWYAGDLHVHTVHSDGNSEPSRVLEMVREAGLDFVAITDHNNTTHALANPPDVTRRPLHIIGEEITTPGGHANVWGLRAGDWLDFRIPAGDPRIGDLAEGARMRGALFSINHPDDDCDGCDWRQPVPAYLSAVEVWNGPFGPQPAAVRFWDDLLRAGRRVTGVASSDWHRPPAPVGAGSVRVLASALTEHAILDGIRSGAVVMMRDPTSPPPVLTVAASGRVAGVGETLVAGAGEALEVRVAMPAFTSSGLGACPSACEVEFFWNGERIERKPATSETMHRMPAAKGYVRIAVLSGSTVVALTNPIFVEVR